VIGFALALSGPKRRPIMLVASVLLILTVFASPQRAARLGLAVALLLLVVATLWPGRRRRSTRTGDLAILVTGLLGIAAASVFVKSVFGNSQASLVSALPFSKYTTRAVSSSYRQGSVQSRFNEWAAAWPDVRSHLLFGNGLGKTFVHYDIGTAQFITYDITNNIGLDILLRTGIVGLLLFVVALGATFRTALRASRQSASDAVSLLIVTTGAVLGGFIAKGMVESVLNEFRLTPLFGFLVGLVLAFAHERRDDVLTTDASRAEQVTVRSS
jgi:O-antigen ligase